MWMIRWFFIALVLFIIILFLMKNQGLEPISIDFVFGKTDEMSPLTAMFFAFVAGFLTWFVVSLFNFLKMRTDLAAKDKLIKNLKEELNGYRNASLSVQEDADKTMILKKGTSAPEEIDIEPDDDEDD